MAQVEIVEISRPDKQDTLVPTSISHVKSLSSYSWIEAPMPTIAVPGSPALWNPPLKHYQQIKKDSGLVYIAQNAARHPSSPLEPLFRSLYIAHPSFNIHSVDLVTDRNNVRKLLSFVNPSLRKDKSEPFTIEVEVTKDTAIFCRCETANYKIIDPNEFQGHGFEFEKAYTTEIVNNSGSHHRIISYHLGGMKLLVRYETDGYIRDPAQDGNEGSSFSKPQFSLPSKPAYAASDTSALMIKEEGQVVALDSILEIKTRTKKRQITLDEVIPQMWASQTPNLVRAYHKHGRFGCPNVENVTKELKMWEETHHADLEKLVALMRDIVSIVKENGGKAVVRYDCERDKLVVWKNDTGKKFLPDDLYARFEKDEAHLA
ncbi:hypothetical protein BJY00DRAFT_305054 [Aspergillus carlsbadensis]|nr:hypothetical protein BJY00DRAFT_305054 [Aspergillus carlsbadensis]